MRLLPFASRSLLPLVVVLAAGCSSPEQRARELIDCKRLVETVQANPRTTMSIPEGQQMTFVSACVRAIVREFTKEELHEALRYARSDLGRKETSFQIDIIAASLRGDFPPEAGLDPGRLNLARTLVGDDPAAAELATKVTEGIVRCAAKTFSEEELKQLLARASDPLAKTIQGKWHRAVAAALQETVAATQPPP